MVEPEPQPLLRAFDYVYLTAPAGLWDAEPQARSLAVLRRVFAVSRSFRMPAPMNVTTHRHADPDQYAKMAALATMPEAEVEAALVAFHTQHADHVYPAALLDPRHRTGRWP